MPSATASSSKAGLCSTPAAEAVVTQATKASTQSSDNGGRNVYWNTLSVSKLIMAVALFFFTTLLVKYYNLKPRMDIEHKLVICKNNIVTSECVQESQVDDFTDIFAALVSVLETQGANYVCSDHRDDQGETEVNKGLSLFDIKDAVEKSMEDTQDVGGVLAQLASLIIDNPQLGISVANSSEGQLALAINNPQVDWHCWLTTKILEIGNLTIYAILLICCIIFVSAIVYGGYWFYLWRHEVTLRVQQDVFELVEQVLVCLTVFLDSF